jgi:heparan-alpha-glucosaminide N-acetyltransferase
MDTTAGAPANPPQKGVEGGKPEAQRYLPLDAYRGLIMILLVSGGFGFSRLPKTALYLAIALQFEHRPWGGAVFYDLIMPAFLFMVGVAMPFSLGRRMERGDTFRQIFRHVGLRALKLLLLGQIVVPALNFHNVLTQVAATYFICFLLMQLKFRYQVLAAFLLLASHSALYLLFPGPDGAFQQVTNVGARIDRAIMGNNYPWPCNNINFLAETPGVLFGVWTGVLLRKSKTLPQLLKLLGTAATAAFAAGLLLSPLVPINKWLWTASYTLYTTGWSLVGLLLFFVLVKVLGIRKAMFPLVVVGMNSLVVYFVGQVQTGWINRVLRVFTGGFRFVGTFAPVLQSCAVTLCIWGLAYWLYKRRIFIKV